MNSGRVTTVALTVLLAITAVEVFWATARSSAGIDFYQMWAGARIAREAPDFYSPQTRSRMGEAYFRAAVEQHQSPRTIAVARFRRDLQTFGSPLLYTFFGVFRGTYEHDLLLFDLLMLVACAVWVAVFVRLFGWSACTGALLFAVLLLAFRPVRGDALAGNVNEFLTLAVAVASWLMARRRFAAAGALLAIATLVKPLVILAFAITLLFWIARRRWRDLGLHIAGAFVAAIAAVVASSLYFRSWSIWPEWIRSLRAMPQDVIPLESGNVAVPLVIQRFTGLHSPAVLLIVVLAAAAFVAFRFKPDADAVLIPLGCVAFELSSPLVWVHYLVLGVPLLMFLMRPAAKRPWIGAVALLLVATDPWAIVIASPVALTLLVIAGIALAYAAALYDVART